MKRGEVYSVAEGKKKKREEGRWGIGA